MKLYKVCQILLLILYVFMIAFFTYQCLKDGVASAKSSDTVANKIADIQEKVTNQPVVVNDQYKISVRKIVGHFGYFALFGLVSVLFWISVKEIRFKAISISIHYVLGIGFAFISEFLLEKNTSGRGASINDVLIDSSGFISLSLLFLIVLGIRYLVKRKKNDIQ